MQFVRPLPVRQVAEIDRAITFMRYLADKAKRAEGISSTVNTGVMAAALDGAIADGELGLLMLRDAADASKRAE